MEARNKRVLITGGSGFLGKFVVKKFMDAGSSVFVPRSRDYNLINYLDAKRVYEEFKPHIVIHLAARVGGIYANMKSPGRFFYENMAMGINMIELGRLYGVEKFVMLGTTCAYPKFCPLPFKEEDLWNGYPEETNAPYGVAKRALGVMIKGYNEEYGFNGIYLILGNLYGPGDNFDLKNSHVIPALIRKFVEAVESGNKTVTVWGTGKPTREFLYVEDAAEAIFLATLKYNKPEPVNIGSGFEVSIKQLVDLIAELTGFKGEIIWDTSMPDGQPRRRLDTSKAFEEFGFKAKTDFTTGLKRTIEWYKENKALIK